MLDFGDCAHNERRDGIGREPFANAQRFSNRRYNYICAKISHANAKDFIIRPKYSDI
jgi:hypothetical protein